MRYIDLCLQSSELSYRPAQAVLFKMMTGRSLSNSIEVPSPQWSCEEDDLVHTDRTLSEVEYRDDLEDRCHLDIEGRDRFLGFMGRRSGKSTLLFLMAYWHVMSTRPYSDVVLVYPSLSPLDMAYQSLSSFIRSISGIHGVVRTSLKSISLFADDLKRGEISFTDQHRLKHDPVAADLLLLDEFDAMGSDMVDDSIHSFHFDRLIGFSTPSDRPMNIVERDIDSCRIPTWKMNSSVLSDVAPYYSSCSRDFLREFGAYSVRTDRE